MKIKNIFMLSILFPLNSLCITLTFINTTKESIHIGFSQFRINHLKQTHLSFSKVESLPPLKTTAISLPDQTNYKYPYKNYPVCYHVWSAKNEKNKWQKNKIFAENICINASWQIILNGDTLVFKQISKQDYEI